MKPNTIVLYKSRDIYLYICDFIAKTFNKLYQRHSSKKLKSATLSQNSKYYSQVCYCYDHSCLPFV